MSDLELKINLDNSQLYKFINWLEYNLEISNKAGIFNGLTKSIDRVHTQLLRQEFEIIEEDPTIV